MPQSRDMARMAPVRRYRERTAMGQALSGVAEAYSSPGQPLRTGIVSVADESCATLTFGGILVEVISAQKPGRGQKVKRSKPLCWTRRCE